MVRIKEIKDKFSVNQSFRNWKASHTFGGTTKAKPLYIAGFRRKNFYYVAGITGAMMVIGAITGGVSVRKSVNKAVFRGQAEGAMGQLVATRVVESNIKTMTSDGILVLTTEISSFETTVQRGAGTTVIRTTGADGERITIPGAITFITNSDDRIVEKTLIGSTFFVTQTNGITVPTTVYGMATTLTDQNGDGITSIMFSELTVVTQAGGEISTLIRTRSSSTQGVTGVQSTPSTQVGGSTVSQTMSTGSAPSSGTSPSPSSTVSVSSLPPSSSVSSARPTSASSSAAGGGSGGDLFQGEGTFYTPGLGSCGIDSTEADFVAALSRVLFDATGVANSNNNPYCGRKALVKAAGAARFLKRDVITQMGVIDRVWYSGNLTLVDWARTREMKQNRRRQMSSEIEQGRENSPNSRPPQEHDLLPMATPGHISKHYALDVAMSPHPTITPPPQKPGTALGKRQAGGGGVTITIVDRCPVCKQYDLDLSPAAYDVIGEQDAGRVAIEWSWLD